MNRPVAIKIGVALGTDLHAMERFERETRTLAGLAHPNIVAIHDFGVDGGDRYMVSEWVEGSTVAAMLADGPLPVARVVALATQICDGLSAAHTAGVVHGDVKPSNLIVTSAGVVKICDFGMAALRNAGGQESSSGTAATRAISSYLAPEQAAGDPIDARTDLYQLGCTIYTMLTGTRPFAGGSALHVLSRHLTRPPAPVQAYRGDVPADLDKLVGQLLAKSRADRPSDAGLVKARLAALSAEPAPPALATVGGRILPRMGVTARPIVISQMPPPHADDPVAGPTGAPDPDDVDSAAVGTGRRRLGSAMVAAVVGVPVVLAVATTALLTGAGSGQPSGQPPATPAATAGAASNLASGPAASRPTQGPAPDRPRSGALPTGPAVPGGTPGPPSTPDPALTIGPALTVGPALPGATAPTSPTVTPVATVAVPADLRTAIYNMQTAIEEQVQAGQLDPTSGDDLQSKVNQIAREASEGDWTAAKYYAAKLREKLGKLLDDGRLTVAGYETLIVRLDAIDEALS